MKTKNERLTAAYIVHAVIQHGKNLTEVLEQHSTTPYIQELCFGSIRFYFQLKFYLSALLKKRLNKEFVLFESLLLVGLYELTYTHTANYAVTYEIVNAVKQSVPQQKWLHALLNAILRNYVRQKKSLDASLVHDPVFNYAHPLWYINAIEQHWPKHSQSIFHANNQYPPLYLRINALKTSREQYLTLLADAHIEALPVPYTECGIQLMKPCLIDKIPGFFQGLCSIQDVAAQLAAPLLQLTAGQRVLDACAAPGGKTTHLLEMNAQLEYVLAIDHDAKRCEKINQNLQRLSLQAVVRCADASQPEQYWDILEDGRLFDRILLDAPCSATGVIRRHPDIKLLRHASDIAQFQTQQKNLLATLWPLLKCDGLLLYVTCSILPEENELMISEFLTHTHNARAEPIQLPIGHTLGWGHQILPGDANTDGFYYALLRKLV